MLHTLLHVILSIYWDRQWLAMVYGETAPKKKGIVDIIHEDDFEASRNFKVSFKQQIQTLFITDAPLWKYYLSIFEVLYALLWVQDFFFHLRTTHFSWTIPKLSSIRYIKVQKKNPEHLKAKQNLQFFSILF